MATPMSGVRSAQRSGPAGNGTRASCTTTLRGSYIRSILTKIRGLAGRGPGGRGSSIIMGDQAMLSSRGARRQERLRGALAPGLACPRLQRQHLGAASDAVTAEVDCLCLLVGSAAEQQGLGTCARSGWCWAPLPQLLLLLLMLVKLWCWGDELSRGWCWAGAVEGRVREMLEDGLRGLSDPVFDS
eukprot:scaffold110388_cov18-Tisochrysis_lutea.AAC.2